MSLSYRIGVRGASIAMLLTAVSPLALAGQATAATDKSATEVGEVVVTANRSGAESIQHLAMAVTAVNTEQLDRQGTETVLDLEKYAPSLVVTQNAPGSNKFDMRGLSTGPYASSDTSDRSLVAVYLDDTPISVQGQTPDLRVYDLDRVEILRGPQGTLYGAGSMSGTIRFITAKPTTSSMFGTLEVGGATTQGGAGSYNYRGMINLPVTDKFAVRASFYHGEDGGWIDNIGLRDKKNANLDRTTQARVAARWTPTSRLTIDASITYEKSRAYGLNVGWAGLPGEEVSTNGPEGTRDDFQLYSVGLDYDLGFADLVSSTSYTWRRIGFQASIEPTIGYFFQDYGTGLPVGPGHYPLYTAPTSYNQQINELIPPEFYQITNKLHDYMQEIRLVSKNDGPVKWTVGGFFEHQRRNLYQDIPVPGFDTLSYQNAFNPPWPTPDGLYNSQTVDGAFHPNDIFSGLQDETETQYALFTDDTWHVTKRLDVTAGVRYFNFKENYYLYEGGVYGVVNDVPLTQKASLSSHGFNPRGNISYKVTDDFMVWGEVAKGFRYGGANQPVPLGTTGVAGLCTQNLAGYGYTSAPLTFGPDHLWSYSIGEKARVADGRVTLNADAYYVDWSDVQTRLLLNCSYFFTDNKGKVRSEGVEVETTARVTPEFTLSANLSYNDSRANGNINTVGAFSGDLAPYSPRWIAGVSAFYDRKIDDGTLHVQLSYQYRGDEHTTFNPLATTIQSGMLVATGPSPTFAVIPASNNVDASIAYDIGRYEFGVFGNNLTNGVKVTDIGRPTYWAVYQAGNSQTYARPRTVGARLKVKF